MACARNGCGCCKGWRGILIGAEIKGIVIVTDLDTATIVIFGHKRSGLEVNGVTDRKPGLGHGGGTVGAEIHIEAVEGAHIVEPILHIIVLIDAVGYTGRGRAFVVIGDTVIGVVLVKGAVAVGQAAGAAVNQVLGNMPFHRAQIVHGVHYLLAHLQDIIRQRLTVGVVTPPGIQGNGQLVVIGVAGKVGK